MLRQFVYPADVERDEAGYFLVTFPDFPEAGTDGETLEEALAEAADCLAEAVAGRIARTENIPKAARKQKDQYAIAIPAQIAAKVALYLAMKATGIGKSDLARRLGRNVKSDRVSYYSLGDGQNSRNFRRSFLRQSQATGPSRSGSP